MNDLTGARAAEPHTEAQTDAASRPAGGPSALRAPRLDAEARALLRWINLAPGRLEDHPLAAQRGLWRMTALAMGQRPPVAEVRTLFVEGPGGAVEMRVFTPRAPAGPLPAFLWCHGGAFMVGGLDTADSICRTIARKAGCIAVAVRYRLAPEHPLTACREDVAAALAWLAQHGATLGIDTQRLAIGGDSAGGNIAAAVAQRARHEGGPRLCLQVLAYPATDLVAEFPSVAENASGYLITARMLHTIKRRMTLGESAQDPWLSPRREGDLRGLPPTVLLSAGFDPIRDDGLDYAARLRAAGVPVELLHYAGQFHGFLNFDSVIHAGRDALARVAAALRDAFAGAPAKDRTVEIADAPAGQRPVLLAVAGEVARTALVGWAGAERMGLTLLGRLAPVAAGAARFLLSVRLAPATYLWRSALAPVHPLAARQSWPDTGPGGMPPASPQPISPPPRGDGAARPGGARARPLKEKRQ